ncbi:MAG: aminotransferase class I/II-fold pyridoxal phosphate-dependent enzyme [Actinomycetota bacterium]|nr:aminotransferase class I/II-fold pyridoxal phosphate-dependent enzyme [Actinomycetota bacterium]
MPIEIESPEQLGYDTMTNNLSESSVADRRLSDLDLGLDIDDLLLCYGDHLGHPGLREQIVADAHGVGPDDVIAMPGASAALYCVSTSQLGPGDHAVILRTNYATNIETPRAIGADIDFLDLDFADGWALDLDRLATLIRPETKLVSLTYPHNPTGAVLRVDELEAVIDLIDRSNAVLLLDETYRDLTHDQALPMAASMSERAVSVASLSKAYGLPGLRLGWLVCRDPARRETLLAAKEQIFICGATLDEAIGAAVLADRDRLLSPIREQAREHRDIVARWIAAEPLIEWVAPAGGVVCFPRVRHEVAFDGDEFYRCLLAEHGTYVGPGHWFEADDRHMRIGYGWPTTDELRAGLAGVSAALHHTLQAVGPDGR